MKEVEEGGEKKWEDKRRKRQGMGGAQREKMEDVHLYTTHIV